ncbi:hypothetical protein L1049_026575 [Liquidambar formosana]|uniref:non-specific serine/threonine protein kinase n=1 Tax=Liquidambar formosana TaxID=63359 RepID=A0AAP0R5J8_LIQFO
MKRSSIVLLWLIAAFPALIAAFSNSGTSISNPNRIAFKTTSLLPPTPKHDVAVMAALDGTIYLVEINSRKIVSSFTSGPSIYSSYQAFLNHGSDNQIPSEMRNDFFIDCGDDWELYMHGSRFGKRKLSRSAEEYIRSTPYISEDGGVTLGSKKTTVFLVDAKSGTVIHTFRLADSPSTLGVQSDEEKPVLFGKDVEELEEFDAVDFEAVEQPLYITRTDYTLQHFSSKSGKVLWNVTFAEFEATFRCQGLGSEYSEDIGLPLHCQTRAVVYRFRDCSFSKFVSVFDRLPNAHPGGRALSLIGGRALSLPAPDHNPFLEPVDKLAVARHLDEGKMMLALPPPKIEYSGILAIHSGGGGKVNVSSTFAELIIGSRLTFFIPFLLPVLSIMGFIFYRSLAARGQGKLNKQGEEFKEQAGIAKKKKARKSGNKNSASFEKRQKSTSHANKVGETNELQHMEIIERNSKLIFSNLADVHVDGRKIGKLLVSNIEIAKGSNGTIVLEGIYDGRPVAVKRLVQTHHDVALKEIQNLIAADQHPNIVRWYGVEYDQDFVYLSLERCTCSLNDLVTIHSASHQSQVLTGDQDSNFLNEHIMQLHSIMGNNKDLELWKANEYPSPQLIKLMRDVVSGLAHLHEIGIIHRDLKPQNVLIIKERSLCAKLSDMGISKRLVANMSSLTQHATGYGSSGWQAPEQLLNRRQTRAVDLFSLGCVLFFCVTGGKHPYGDSLERDVNIVNNRKDLFLVENIPEAVDLFSHLLDPDPDSRPKALDVLRHPFFWSSEMRLSFLRDASDRVELEDRENASELLKALESTATVALNGKWDEKMESAFLNDIGRYRRYKFDSIRDLLRVIRNKLNHYRELPQEIREILGQVPEGFDSYFSSRFPRLLMEVYKVIYRYCREEEFFFKYTKSNLT